jgi:hypothetical protein
MDNGPFSSKIEIMVSYIFTIPHLSHYPYALILS